MFFADCGKLMPSRVEKLTLNVAHNIVNGNSEMRATFLKVSGGREKGYWLGSSILIGHGQINKTGYPEHDATA